MKTDEMRFREKGTQMPETVQQMYDYDSSLAMLVDRFDHENDPHFDVNERIMLYNYLKDLQLYRKLVGSLKDL